MVEFSDALFLLCVHSVRTVYIICMYALSVHWKVFSRMLETDMSAAHFQSDEAPGNPT